MAFEFLDWSKNQNLGCGNRRVRVHDRKRLSSKGNLTMAAAVNIERHDTDILIIGTGGAGLFAALHAQQASPTAKITIAVKGLIGKCGCTRMVQGGYNVALGAGDKLARVAPKG